MSFEGRKTRGGRVFSPYVVHPVHTPHIDLPDLIRSACLEQDAAGSGKEAEFDEHEAAAPEPSQRPSHAPSPPASVCFNASNSRFPAADGASEVEQHQMPKEARPAPPPHPLPPPSTTDDGPWMPRRARYRKRKRQERVEEDGYETYPAKRAAYIDPAEAVETAVDLPSLPVTSCGYAAARLPRCAPTPSPPSGSPLQAYLDAGYELVESDGITPRPVVGPDGTIYMVLAGRPDCPGYVEACQTVAVAMLAAGENAHFRGKELDHKRGTFPAVNVGVTHAMGTGEPKNLYTPHQAMVDDLLALPALQRMSKFANSAFQMWAPSLYSHYKRYTDTLFGKMPNLRRLFGPTCVFVCAAFNLGRRVVTKRHRDQLNLPFGWCAVHALGWFDYKKGGHMVIDDAKKVIEFPPASLILLPSASLTHHNVGVQEGETRLSFTQYCGGGIFRFVDNGFRLESAVREQDPSEYLRLLELKKTRWAFGLSLFSKLHELVTPAPVPNSASLSV